MGSRTPDLLHAMQALYQLSYIPVGAWDFIVHLGNTSLFRAELVLWDGQSGGYTWGH